MQKQIFFVKFCDIYVLLHVEAAEVILAWTFQMNI